MIRPEGEYEKDLRFLLFCFIGIFLLILLGMWIGAIIIAETVGEDFARQLDLV